MSQRFIRCSHCGLPHDEMQAFCPSTGLAVKRDRIIRPTPFGLKMPTSAPPPPIVPPSTMPPRNPKRELIGKTIGDKYVVRSVLGEGGMGTVFEAEHLTIGRAVAVKVLHPSQARKKDAVRRFHQEARAAGAIGHPNICEVYDLGTLDDGSPYLVMEKLVGETLADRIAAEGGLPFDDVIDTLVQVLSGLVAAHEKGIVHRDIKPENVFLTRRVGCPPVCKLLDFGVSKMIGPLIGGKDDDLDLTRTGMVMGTPYYMSPEQARGDRNLDARVDLYACGVILYEALTGRRPFTAANYNALLLQILGGSPKPARAFRPALPAGFDAVLDKALARSREDRYQTANDLQRDLQALRDKHTGTSAAVGEAARAMAVASLFESGPPPPRPPEPTPSSVEIPIVVAGDTPLSGESMPVDATELASRRPSVSDAQEFEEYPTQVQQRPEPGKVRERDPRLGRKPGISTPGRAPVRRVSDTDVMGRSPVQDTDVSGRSAIADTDPSARRPSGAPREDHDTVIRSSSPFPLPKRRARRPSSPDDTLRVDEGGAQGGEDPTQLMALPAPKSPRRT